MYEQISIWKVIDTSSAIRYFCLKDVLSGKYRVQSADFFYKPFNDKMIDNFNYQLIELLLENYGSDEIEWFDSINDAVNNHDLIFCNNK